MNRYRMKVLSDGGRRYYYIWDDQEYDIPLRPAQYLKLKTTSGKSPQTVRFSAYSLSIYYNYILETGLQIEEVTELSYTEQHQHFVRFLHWVKAGMHLEKQKNKSTGNRTCNAYLKEVFRFFSYMNKCGYTKPLCVLSVRRAVVENNYRANLIFTQKSFDAYLKEQDNSVQIAEQSEIEKVLIACTNTRDRLLLILLAETGFRIGELLGVDYTKDIDYQKHSIRVRFREYNENNSRAKNAECRTAKISDEAFDFLLHYLAEYRKLLQKQSLLFINIKGDTAGKPMRVESVYDMLKRMEKKIGIKIRPHMLRRYYAVSRRNAGWPLELIQFALGHKHLDTTVKYLGILDDQLMKASCEYYKRHSDIYGIKDLLNEQTEI